MRIPGPQDFPLAKQPSCVRSLGLGNDFVNVGRGRSFLIWPAAGATGGGVLDRSRHGGRLRMENGCFCNILSFVPVVSGFMQRLACNDGNGRDCELRALDECTSLSGNPFARPGTGQRVTWLVGPWVGEGQSCSQQIRRRSLPSPAASGSRISQWPASPSSTSSSSSNAIWDGSGELTNRIGAVISMTCRSDHRTGWRGEGKTAVINRTSGNRKRTSSPQVASRTMIARAERGSVYRII